MRAEHPAWRGGRVEFGPYIMLYVPGHPLAQRSGYLMEHRFRAAEHWGVDAVRNKDVHHVDGNQRNNNIENLLLMTHSEHVAHHNRERAGKTRRKAHGYRGGCIDSHELSHL